MNKATLTRPQSLAEIARETTGPRDFNTLLAEFLDEFNADSSFARIEDEPARMVGRFDKAEVADVELAAVADAMAERIGMACPPWAEKRSMPHPCFAYDDEELNALLLRESPPAFRKRNLFVSENALSRA